MGAVATPVEREVNDIAKDELCPLAATSRRGSIEAAGIN